jgi:hypothetical protein
MVAAAAPRLNRFYKTYGTYWGAIYFQNRVNPSCFSSPTSRTLPAVGSWSDSAVVKMLLLHFILQTPFPVSQFRAPAFQETTVDSRLAAPVSFF